MANKIYICDDCGSEISCNCSHNTEKFECEKCYKWYDDKEEAEKCCKDEAD